MILLDVMTLSVLFTIRLYAGAAATGVFISNWLLTFSLFLFLSLALVKRFSEIFFMQNGSKVLGRGYSKSDGGFINTLGISSGMIAVLILGPVGNCFFMYQIKTTLLKFNPQFTFSSFITRNWYKLIRHG